MNSTSIELGNIHLHQMVLTLMIITGVIFYFVFSP